MNAPANVAASDGAYSNHVAITWDAVSGADEYQVFRDDEALSDWISALTFDDFGATAPLVTSSGCAGTNTEYTYHEYHVVARNDCGNQSTASATDTGYVGSEAEKALGLQSETIREMVFPVGTAHSNSALALRIVLKDANDQVIADTVWAELERLDGVEQGGTWRPVQPGDNSDGWVILTPASPLLPGSEVTLIVGAATANGYEVEPLTHTFTVDGTLDAGEPLVEEVAFGFSAFSDAPVYAIMPDTVFMEPVPAQLPLPAGGSLDNCRLLYYSASPGHAGWYPAEHVDGWLEGSPEVIAASNGLHYLQFQVNHGGFVQIAPADSGPYAATRSSYSDMGLFALAFAMLGFLSSRHALAQGGKRRR